MAGKIVITKTITSHSLIDFDEDVAANIAVWQSNGYACKVYFKPLMLPTGKVLYTAMIEARE